MMEMMEMTIDYKYQILKINLTSLNLNIKKLVFSKIWGFGVLGFWGSGYCL